uniref:PDZ domain-containing protein n=1 Tax=Caenorhabditis tropicalis TaxID=1561998 RepID=A0A1I7UXC4_9PELO
MRRCSNIIEFLTQGCSNSCTRQSKETPVFVPPPPPPTDVMPYLPRLAELKKSTPSQEFGFNLHAERNKGHFIGTVDQGGIGQAAGLVMGQRIVGVNGELIYPTTGHKEVVALIKKDNMKTTLLVASEEVDKWHNDHNVKYSWDNVERIAPAPSINVETYHPHEEVAAPKANGYDVPPLNPHSIQVNEEREISKMTTTTKTETVSTNNASYQYKESNVAYDAYAAPPAAESGDLMDQVFGKVNLPTVGNQVTIHSHTEELPSAEDASSVSSLSSHRESAVDVPVTQYVPSYATQSHQQHEQHSQTHHHHHHHNQQPSPLSNGSSHGYAASSTSGYDDDDIYHLSASEARERLRMKNRKHHLNEMSLNEKYQLVSNM